MLPVPAPLHILALPLVAMLACADPLLASPETRRWEGADPGADDSYRYAVADLSLPEGQRPASAGNASRLAGVVTYDDRPYDTEGFTGSLRSAPAQHVVVEWVEGASGAVIAQTITDADGRFALEAGTAPRAPSYVRALAAGRVRGLKTVVRDRGEGEGAVYALRTPIQDTLPSYVVLHAPASSPIAGAFNITDVATEGLRFLVPWLAPDATGTLTWRWQAGMAFRCGSCYRDNVISVGGAVEDPDEFDDDILLHELAHWFVHNFSADSSPGGPHRERRVSPQLAYAEGLAYFLAGLIRGTPHIVDNYHGARRWIDMAGLRQNGVSVANMRGTSDGTLSGTHREELVSGVLWHAWQPGTRGWDRLAIGTEGHMHILTALLRPSRPLPDVGAAGIDLADWALAALCGLRVDPAALQDLLDHHAYPFDVAAHASHCGDPATTPLPAPPDRPAGAPDPAPDARRPAPLRQPSLLATSSTRKDGTVPTLGLLLEGDTLRLQHVDQSFREIIGEVTVALGERRETAPLRCTHLPCVIATGVTEGTLVTVLARVDGVPAGGAWAGREAVEAMSATSVLRPHPGWGTLREYMAVP